MSPRRVFVAGTRVWSGVEALAQLALAHDIEIILLDSTPEGAVVEPLWRISDALPSDVRDASATVVPLLEEWVTRLLAEATARGRARNISLRALRASRSKLALTRTLEAAGLSAVPRWQTGQEPRPFADDVRLIVRNDYGYSGKGVLASEHRDVGRTVARLREVFESPDYARMQAVVGETMPCLICEPYLEGPEWSADAIVGTCGIEVVRVVRKVVVFEEGVPSTVGYFVPVDVAETHEVALAVRQWAKVLFDAGDISFAQFDVRRNHRGELVPLDFSCRPGNGLWPLLARAAPGAHFAALLRALAGEVVEPVIPTPGWCQLLVRPPAQGLFGAFRLNLAGDVFVSGLPARGALVGQPPRARSTFRVADVVLQVDSLVDFERLCASPNLVATVELESGP